MTYKLRLALDGHTREAEVEDLGTDALEAEIGELWCDISEPMKATTLHGSAEHDDENIDGEPMIVKRPFELVVAENGTSDVHWLDAEYVMKAGT